MKTFFVAFVAAVLVAGCTQAPMGSLAGVNPTTGATSHAAPTLVDPVGTPVPSVAPLTTSVAPAPASRPKAPEVTDVFTTAITETAATVSWTVAGPGAIDSYVVYGHNNTQVEDYNPSQDSVANASVTRDYIESQHAFGAGPQQLGLSDLAGTYYYEVVSVNAGGFSPGPVQGFTTAPPPPPADQGTVDGASSPTPATEQDNGTGAATAADCGSGNHPPTPDLYSGAAPTNFGASGLHFGLCPNMTIWAGSLPGAGSDLSIIKVWCGSPGPLTLKVQYGITSGASDYFQTYPGLQPSLPNQPPCVTVDVSNPATGLPYAPGTLVFFEISLQNNDGFNPGPGVLSFYTVAHYQIQINAGALTSTTPYAPMNITISHGMPVMFTFVNYDSVAHNLQFCIPGVVSCSSNPGLPANGTIVPNGNRAILAPHGFAPGHYQWGCLIHRSMMKPGGVDVT
ncbi:MAG: hypothetical protein ACYDBQ_07690 [Thermoplasmatota archaeon]